MSGFDFGGMRELQQQTRRMEEDFDRFIRRFLLRQALDALARTKANTPVDTGLLRAAWTVGDGVSAARGQWSASAKKMQYTEDVASSTADTLQSVRRVGDALIITIINPVEYASFVEYGHMTRNRKRWIEGRFMCTLAIDDVAKLIPQRFEAEFTTWVRGLGV